MPKLTYWVAENLHDSEVYNIRRKTRKEAKEAVAAAWNTEDFGPVHKVVVEYADAFDLARTALGEGRIYEGAQ
jgi:hypothetical protein